MLLAALAAVAALGTAALAGDARLQTMWTVDGARAFSGFSSRDCRMQEFSDPERALVPAGLRGEGRRIRHECGARYVRLELPGELHGKRWVLVTEAGVSVRPPRANPWQDVRPKARGWMRGMANSNHRTGIPLDRPDWRVPIKMRPGESFEVLDPQIAVVRTVAGRVVLLSPFAVLDADPLAGKRERQAARDAWERGRAHRCDDRPITPIPTSADLLANRGLRGTIYEVDLDTDDVSAERFEAAWLDPTGQLLQHACDDRSTRDADPCGAYWLDYSELGAWWPERDTVLLALFDGVERVDGQDLPRLRVLVRAPWKETRPVAPAWAGETVAPR